MTTPIDAELLEAHIQINCLLLFRIVLMLGAVQLYVSCRCMQQFLMFSFVIIRLTMRHHFNRKEGMKEGTCLFDINKNIIQKYTLVKLYRETHTKAQPVPLSREPPTCRNTNYIMLENDTNYKT